MNLSLKLDCFWSNIIHIFQCDQNWLRVDSLAPSVLTLTIPELKYCRFLKGSENRQPGDSCQWEQVLFCRQGICTEIQYNTIKKRSVTFMADIFSSLLSWRSSCALTLYMACDTRLVYWVLKVTGEKIFVLLKVFVPLVAASAVMSLKASLCYGFVISSGQRKEEPFSEIWLCSNHYYTCQTPFRMQINNGSS